MNEQQLEQLSAFADAESCDPAAVDALMRDPALRARLARYQLIGDAMRDQLPPALDRGFADRVREAIAAEPYVLTGARRAPRLLRPALGVAIAASVAALGVFVSTRLTPEPPGSGAPAIALQTAPATSQFGAAVAPVTFEPAQVTVNELNRYILQHNEQRQTVALPGTLQPYVRLIGHDARE